MSYSEPVASGVILPVSVSTILKPLRAPAIDRQTRRFPSGAQLGMESLRSLGVSILRSVPSGLIVATSGGPRTRPPKVSPNPKGDAVSRGRPTLPHHVAALRFIDQLTVRPVRVQDEKATSSRAFAKATHYAVTSRRVRRVKEPDSDQTEPAVVAEPILNRNQSACQESASR